ncbi:antirestriction protein ArdA [Leucobacter luti]|uniref:Antirestriction protein ArdA n=1 Tax=Leucobacter luti TaxID=340320 RepID=A0A4Q7TYX4_9MICO|nr:antirestriction protein ArdA [Leucobacter luti]MBL3698987.1 antirestriction protein ArdA [Leucobacter luti]RZT66364.1 antirestriction protein ArdA [Leucobacter luti]
MTAAAMEDTTPRVFISCLACYNAGRLVGEWFDAAGADGIGLAEVHGSPSRVRQGCEELWVMDHENIPVRGEMSPHDAARWAETIEEADEHLRPALFAWVRSGSYTAQGSSDLPVVSDFIDKYCGHYESFRDYLEQLADDTAMFEGIPDVLQSYFDWDRFAADEAHSYATEDAPDGGVFIFAY